MRGDVGGDRRDLGVETHQARAERGARARVVLLLGAGGRECGVERGLGLGQVVQGGQRVSGGPGAGSGPALGDGGLGIRHQWVQGCGRHLGSQPFGVDQVGGDRGDGRRQVRGGALEALPRPGDLGGEFARLGDRALGDAHLLHSGGVLARLDGGSRLVQGGAPGLEQTTGALGSLRDRGERAGRIGGVEGDQQGVGHGDRLLGLIGPLGGLGHGGRQIRLQAAAGIEGGLLLLDDADGVVAPLEDLAVHLALDGLGLRDVVVQELAQLEGAGQVPAGGLQRRGEGVRRRQAELGLGVGQLLGGRAHGVVGCDQRLARPDPKVLDRHHLR